MKVWGFPAFVKRRLSYKLEDKYDKCLFVGYPKETLGYQFYNSLEQKVFVSKNVVFWEKGFKHMQINRLNMRLTCIEMK